MSTTPDLLSSALQIGEKLASVTAETSQGRFLIDLSWVIHYGVEIASCPMYVYLMYVHRTP